MVISQILNLLLTIVFGVSVLVLISLGLAVIFGMMGILNLAHGEFMMLGAYSVLVGHRLGLNIWFAMLLAPLVVGCIGLVLERLIIRYLYGRLLDTMLATWGLSLVLVQVAVLVFGTSTRGMSTPLSSFKIGRYSVSQYSIAVILITSLLVFLVYYCFKFTKYGVMAQATTQLPEMASSLGINSSRVNMLTFAFGAALAGAAGGILAPIVGVVPTMGNAYIAQAFMTVIVGGPVVLSGAVLSSGILGTVDSITSYVFTPFLGQGALLILAILLLRVLPRGISGNWRRQL